MPSSRPDDAELALAEPAPKSKKKNREAGSRKGSVCGVNAIKGEKIAPIKSKVKGCGLKDGVRVTSVSGVALSQGATIDCATAKALNTWVERVVQPAFRDQVVESKVAAHYICRSRNNVKGAKVSEHGRGKAVDIAALVLANGKVLSVAQNYRRCAACTRAPAAFSAPRSAPDRTAIMRTTCTSILRPTGPAPIAASGCFPAKTGG